MFGRPWQSLVGLVALGLAAGILALGSWGGVSVGGLTYPLAVVLAACAVAFLGSSEGRPAGLIRVPLVAGLVLVAVPALGTGYRFAAPMTAAGILLLACWAGMAAWARRSSRRAQANREAGERVREEVSEDLARARRLLPSPGEGAGAARFDGLILRGELAAALGELEAVGAAAGAPPDYWHALAAAAGRMGLADAQARLAGRVGPLAPAGDADPAEPPGAADRLPN